LCEVDIIAEGGKNFVNSRQKYKHIFWFSKCHHISRNFKLERHYCKSALAFFSVSFYVLILPTLRYRFIQCTPWNSNESNDQPYLFFSLSFGWCTHALRSKSNQKHIS